MINLPRTLAATVLLACLNTAALMSQQPAPKRTPDVVFVPTPHEVVAVMLEMAEVDKNDTVYDLGCGDGRLVITAAQKHGARGVGIDIDPERIYESKENAKKAGVTDRVKFIQADLFETDISPATAVTLYLLPELNRRLQPKLVSSLKPGTPIVSHDFDMGDWKPDAQREVQGPSRTHKVYLWRVPAKVAGSWNWKDSRGRNVTLILQQEHQRVKGVVSIGGQELPIRDARISGDKLSFRVPQLGSDEMKFSGKISGDQIRGASTRGAGRSLAWKAERASEKLTAER